MKIHSIYDNGGITYDRFTVYFAGRGTVRTDRSGHKLRACRGMSEFPCHPAGFGQWCEGQPGKHNGRKITFQELPVECQVLIKSDLQGVASGK